MIMSSQTKTKALNTLLANLTSQTESTQAYARDYIDHGYSVVPMRLDGSKAPSLSSWKDYMLRLPTEQELDQWFQRPAGIGLICGAVSGGLEVIDFDMAELIWPLLSMVPTSLKERLAIYETPGGWHLAYRCSAICGNRKLASWEAAKSPSEKANGHRECTGFKPIGKGVRIETRGEGGLIVAEGSPLSVHLSGLPYCHYMGPTLFTMEPIEPSEREALWAAALTFEVGVRESAAIKRAEQKIYRETHGDSTPTDDEPWTWFDQNGDIPSLLFNAGWRQFGDSGWTRPGKNFGLSAVMGKSGNGTNIVTVFSTSTDLGPVNGQAHRNWGAFNLLAEIKFQGNKKEAAKYVRTVMPKSDHGVNLAPLLRKLGAA